MFSSLEGILSVWVVHIASSPCHAFVRRDFFVRGILQPEHHFGKAIRAILVSSVEGHWPPIVGLGELEGPSGGDLGTIPPEN